MACGAMGSSKDIATLLQPFEERAQLAEVVPFPSRYSPENNFGQIF